jgi:hypothetical protein
MSAEPTTTCPLPTPELVAALANAYIEERAKNGGEDHNNMPRAFKATIGDFDPWAGRGARLSWAASDLARDLNYPMPYETQVTMLDGSKGQTERHTITHFVDGEGYSEADWAAISTLEVGEAYAIPGRQTVMKVTRVE